MKQIKISEIKKQAPHWFSKSNMRFFDTKIHNTELIAGRYFITSEEAEPVTVSGGAIVAPYNGERRFTIREFVNGEVYTVGDFMKYGSIEETILQLMKHIDKFVSDGTGITFNEINKD